MRRTLVAAAAALLACTACQAADPEPASQSSATPGPMRFGNGWTRGCAPASQYQHMAVEQYLRLPRRPAVITRLQTMGAVDLEVPQYKLLIDPRRESIGYVAWPPRTPAWGDVVPALGTTVPARVPVYLVAEIKATSTEGGHLRGTRIHYRVGRERYVATTHNSFRIGSC